MTAVVAPSACPGEARTFAVYVQPHEAEPHEVPAADAAQPGEPPLGPPQHRRTPGGGFLYSDAELQNEDADVRRAKIIAHRNGSWRVPGLLFTDEHGTVFRCTEDSLSEQMMHHLATAAGLATTAPFLFELRQSLLGQPVRPDLVEIAVRLHCTFVPDSLPLSVGTTLTVPASWNTGQILDLLQPGSTALNHEISTAIARICADHALTLCPEWPTWTTEVKAFGRYVPLNSVLAFPHLIGFTSTPGAPRANVLCVRVHARLSSATPLPVDLWRARYVRLITATPLQNVLSRADCAAATDIHRVNRGNACRAAVLYGPAFRPATLGGLQSLYEDIRRRSAVLRD